MKLKELRMIETPDLNNRIKELQKELIRLRTQAATGTPPKSPGQIRLAKRTIARIKTILKTERRQKDK